MSYSKFRNKKTPVDGITFSSRREAKRYQELKILQQAGEIAELKLQPSWTFYVDGNPVLIRSQGFPNGRLAKFVADFSYVTKDGEFVVEDSKGFRTDVFKWKKALMEACHGIVVREV